MHHIPLQRTCQEHPTGVTPYPGACQQPWPAPPAAWGHWPAPAEPARGPAAWPPPEDSHSEARGGQVLVECLQGYQRSYTRPVWVVGLPSATAPAHMALRATHRVCEGCQGGRGHGEGVDAVAPVKHTRVVQLEWGREPRHARHGAQLCTRLTPKAPSCQVMTRHTPWGCSAAQCLMAGRRTSPSCGAPWRAGAPHLDAALHGVQAHRH